jgi:ABC-2 type transport system ATP-binding protein
MIEIRGLVKRFGPVTAVDGLSFDVMPGRVTGFLGPNGAGKTTTMLMMPGLVRPGAGEVRIGGRRYRDLPVPLAEAGVLLEARAFHGGRRARDHLLFLAKSNRIPARRVGEVLALTGIEQAAGKRAKALSLGMAQRLGIAAALLGDPAVLVLDEPLNGLDPEGIAWIRTLMRDLAAQGRTVLFSSHLISEVALAADHLIVIGKGRLIADTTAAGLAASSGQPVLVRSPRASELADRLRHAGAATEPAEERAIRVTGLDAATIAGLAAAAGIAIHELTPQRPSLEEAFMKLTRDHAEFRAGPASPGQAGPGE